MNWPRIADMLIETGWAYGIRTRDIAAAVSIAVDKPVSRNAIIGRAHRNGLPKHPLCVQTKVRLTPPPPPRSPAVAKRFASA